MKKFSFIISLMLLFVFASTGLAEDKDKKKDEKMKLRPGVIASTGKASKTASVDSAFNTSIEKKSKPPIGARVKRVRSGRCEAVLNNNSKESTFSVRYKVEGSRSSGASAFKKHFSARIKAGETVTKSFSCPDDVSGMQVVLKSGKEI